MAGGAPALAALPARGAAVGLPPAVIPAPFGVNIHFTRTTAAEWKLLAESGFRIARTDLTWTAVQPGTAPPNFQSSGYDSLVRHLLALHIRPMLILDYCNPAFPSLATVPGRAAFARFAAAAARHFRGDHVIWEIWNEPDGGFWSCTGQPAPAGAGAYTALAAAASAAIHRANPAALVVGPAAARFDMAWFARLAQDGLLRDIQGFSVHGYGANTPEEAVPEWQALHAFLAAHPVDGRTLPMISGEWGFETYQHPPAGWCCTYGVQADYLVRMMLDNLKAGVAYSIWYDFRDCSAPDAPAGQCHYGVVTQTLQPKPSFTAMRVLTQTFAGQRYVASADVAACGAGEQAIRLDQGGEAFWSTGPSGRSGRFYVGSGRVTLVSQDGVRRQVTAPGGVLTTTYHRAVTYVLGAGSVLPPPPPAQPAVMDSLTALLSYFYAHSVSGNLNALGGAALAVGTGGEAVLIWPPLCGVSAYRLYRSPAKGPAHWALLTTTRAAHWYGRLPSGRWRLAVAAVGPSGGSGPRSTAATVTVPRAAGS